MFPRLPPISISGSIKQRLGPKGKVKKEKRALFGLMYATPDILIYQRVQRSYHDALIKIRRQTIENVYSEIGEYICVAISGQCIVFVEKNILMEYREHGSTFAFLCINLWKLKSSNAVSKESSSNETPSTGELSCSSNEIPSTPELSTKCKNKEDLTL